MSDTHIYCAQCGTQLALGQKFCHECGAPTGVASAADAEQSDTAKASQDSLAFDRSEVAEERIAAVETEESVDGARFSGGNEEQGAVFSATEHDALVDDSTGDSKGGPVDDADDAADSDGKAASDEAAIADEALAGEESDLDSLRSEEAAACERAANAGDPVDDACDAAVDVSVDGSPEAAGEEDGSESPVSDIDIDDSLDPAEGLQGTRPIPVVASSQVPVVAEGVAASSARPGNTTPMPLVTEASGSYAYREDTQVMNPVPAAPRQYRQDSSASASQRDPKRTALIAIIAVLVVVLVALLAVLTFGSQGANDASNTTAAQEAEQPASAPASAEPAQVDEPAEEPTSSQDRAIYNKLNTYYDHLGSYSSDISAAADDFNSNYLTKSYSKRSDCYDDASRLMQEISRDYDALQEVSVTSTSEYYASYNDMLTCYYDCLMRIEVICEAWENSLSYSDPTGHADEICAPLSRDRENGTNKYLAEFEELYPDAKPAEPRS